MVTYRSKFPPEWPAIPYIEEVEEALCFGWIDSTLKRLPDGQLAQRLSPRRPKSHWTQLNMDRCVDLEDRGLMTEAGRQAFEKSFEYKIIPPDSELNQRVKRRPNSDDLVCMSRKDDVIKRDTIKNKIKLPL